MNISPQLRLSISLVALLLSTVFIADFLGLLPRPEEQIRESRKLLGESLAVQFSSAASRGHSESIVDTIEQIVSRNDQVQYAGLWRESGAHVASHGDKASGDSGIVDLSSYESLVIPIYSGNMRWGEVRMRFAPSTDWGLRYLGFPSQILEYMLFLCAACLISFYLFMRRALTELNPTKVVPERVNAAFDVLAEGVLILDESEKVVLANKAFTDRVGLEPEQMIGKNPKIYNWDLGGDGVEELPWQTALRHGEPVTGMPLKMLTEDGQAAFTVNAAPIDNGQGQRKGVLITFDDVTPLEAKNVELASMLAELSNTQKVIEDKNKELERLATRDPLTNCLNRRSFLHTYENHFQSAGTEDTGLSVLMIDIDHFKLVNDNYGHGVGDDAIKVVAKTLQNAFRQNDIVGRYGGEEFVVSLPGASLEQALQVAERTREKISKLASTDVLPMPSMTVSIGVACWAGDIVDHAELLDRADRGLYQAKQSGRDCVCEFDPAFEHATQMVHSEIEQTASVGEVGTELVQQLRSQLKNMHDVVNEQAKEITHRSMHDDLTGLPNRFLLFDRLTQAMKLSARNDNLTAIVSISLSSYQKTVDLMGYEIAENMLKHSAERIERVVRNVDSIGIAFNEQALTFSRIAHNELAILVVDLDGVQSVPKIIGRITRALEKPFNLQGKEVNNQVYCGIAVFPHDGHEADGLIRNASLARNFAERRSENRSGNAYFSKEIDNLAIKNARMATELRKAINNDGLEVVYQPKVDSLTNKVTGVEALARWHHAELGNVGPMEFIRVAEHIGVIDKLTNWVLNRVCSDMAQANLGQLRVSVNVSPIELCDPTTADRILNIIDNHPISPNQIEVEITESSVLNNFDVARNILTKLQSNGVTIALDDFGTAYSSLNLLLEIPVDVIKIDRSFVTELQDAPSNQAVVEAIIHMAKSMDKRVVAEGVEHTRERDCLAVLGCREIQGFLYSKPVAFKELQAYVHDVGISEGGEGTNLLHVG